MCNGPINETGNYLKRAILKTKRLSSKRVKTYLPFVVPLGECAVAAKLFDYLGLQVDKGSYRSVQFVAIFSTYTVQEQYEGILIAFSTILGENDMELHSI